MNVDAASGTRLSLLIPLKTDIVKMMHIVWNVVEFNEKLGVRVASWCLVVGVGDNSTTYSYE